MAGGECVRKGHEDVGIFFNLNIYSSAKWRGATCMCATAGARLASRGLACGMDGRLSASSLVGSLSSPRIGAKGVGTALRTSPLGRRGGNRFIQQSASTNISTRPLHVFCHGRQDAVVDLARSLPNGWAHIRTALMENPRSRPAPHGKRNVGSSRFSVP